MRKRVARVSFLKTGSFLIATVLLTATGCHSAFVQTSITNLGPDITTMEIDYPSQSFGAEKLGANQVFKYRFKVQGSGPVKLTYNDSGGKAHTSTGPELDEKAEGTLAVIITTDGNVEWHPRLLSSPQH